MNLFGMMETSGGAMEAERMRAEVVAANMANAETTRTEDGGPYHRQEVVFAANNQRQPNFLDSITAASPGGAAANLRALALPDGSTIAPGVHISAVVQDPSPPLKRYDPGIPTPGRTVTSPIPTLIPSQRWWTLWGRRVHMV